MNLSGKIFLISLSIIFFNTGGVNSVFANDILIKQNITEQGPKKKKFKKRKNIRNQQYIKKISDNGSTKNQITGKNGNPHTKPAKIFLTHSQAKRKAKQQERQTKRNGRKVHRR